MKKGVGVATLSGVMSACFAYGLAAGDPIKALTIKHGTPDLWQGLPVLVVVLIGRLHYEFHMVPVAEHPKQDGLPILHFYITRACRSHPDHDETIIETALDAPSREVVEHMTSARTELRERTTAAVADAAPA